MKRVSVAAFLFPISFIFCLSIAPLSYGAPEPTVELEVLANHQIVQPDTKIQLKLGDSLQLKVTIVGKDLDKQDVTNNPKTYYTSITPWILQVNASGTVTATSDSKFQVPLPTEASPEIGIVAVTYGHTGDMRIGLTSVLFEIKK